MCSLQVNWLGLLMLFGVVFFIAFLAMPVWIGNPAPIIGSDISFS